MYGLEKSVNLEFMRNSELQQICFGLYEIQLHFTKNLSICIESDCHLIDSNDSITKLAGNKPEASKCLVCLLGKKIENVENVGGGEVRLILSGKYTLILLDGNKKTESYNIIATNEEIIV